MNQGGFSAVINGVEHVAEDIGTLVGHAANELASAGIGAFSGMEAFIQFLIQLGEDPVQVISALAGHIIQYGGEVRSVLGDVSSGVLSHGLNGYFTLKTNQALSPVRDALSQQITRGNQIAELHQTTINTMRGRFNTLTAGASVPGATWQGEGADAMITSFEEISQVLSQLSDQIQHNGQQAILNRTFLQVLEFTGELAAGMAVLDILLVIASCVIVVFTEGTAAPVAILIDGGLLALEMDILLDILAVEALAWLIGTLAIYVVNHPIQLGPLSHPQTPPISTTHLTYEYQPNPKHGPKQKGNIGAEPKNGQAALDNSVPIKPTSTRRVGVDPSTDEIVVLDETFPGKGIYHGHVRSWNELTQEMKNALINAGLVDKRGRPIKKK